MPILYICTDLRPAFSAFGDAFAGIGVREPQPRASEAFRAFGDYHRLMEKNGVQTLKTIKPVSIWRVIVYSFYFSNLRCICFGCLAFE